MERYGRLTVESTFMKKNNHGTKRFARCVCDCGKKVDVCFSYLKTGHTKSCGCMAKELLIKRNVTHGDSRTRLYVIWSSMKQRCNYPKSHNYYLYGGRGISVCKEWMEYKSFKDWAESSGYNKNMTIDRIDSDKNYCPDNCQWLTKTQNSIRANESKRKKREINLKSIS